FLEYKAIKRGKIVIKVPAHYSSQECAECGHIHPDNRKSQSEFLCLFCGNEDNADLNAAKVIGKRGVRYLLSRPKAKTKTRLGISRSKARRGISKTETGSLFSQIPMTLEARLL
ncbi:MAG: zinc ribbon domain-containing protein, partial [Candidatus Berkiellales bacterium]